MHTAQTLPDDKAAEIPTLFEPWQPNTAYIKGDRRTFGGKLHKCLQDHVSQADWTPDATPALWAVIDVTHAGTLDDPIPAALNMEYHEGNYYTEGGIIYRCIKDSGISLAYLPSQLVGQYFEAA